MANKNVPQGPEYEPFNIRPDVARIFQNRPFITFEEVYDRLREIDSAGAKKVISLLHHEASRYSDNPDKQQAFAAGILHILGIQLVSREFDSLEASLRLNLVPSDDDGGEDQPRSSEPGDDQPIA